MKKSLTNNTLSQNGVTTISDIYTISEVNSLIETVKNATQNSPNFRQSNDLFAIRNLLLEIPELQNILWNDNIKTLIKNLFGEKYFNVKAIYFDKPPQSNWIVAWHQDLTISVSDKADIEGFTNWTLKQGQPAVQPPQTILENIYTIRIHLDDCDETNGALRVIPKSHQKGVISMKHFRLEDYQEPMTCAVPKGGAMLMKPLILHASNKSTSEHNRRVIHLEFSDIDLSDGMDWREKVNCF
jgi:ectoine hydroxylase-related dioxygenase (phytanoyl-CoA dioxygenase family)